MESAATKRWRNRMIEEGRCVQCGGAKDTNVQSCSACYRRMFERRKEAALKQKKEMFEHYGGAFCSCCKEDEILFLGLDHINNDGNKEAKSGYHLYQRLRKLGFPPGFRVLCHNCNLGRHLNGGTCPHEKSV